MSRGIQRLFNGTLAVVLLLALGIGIAYSQDGSVDTSAIEANKELVRAFVEADNTADFDALDVLLAEDFQRHSSATPGLTIASREDMKEFMRENHAAFPDMAITVEKLVAEADLVAFYAILNATMEGPLGEFPATGATVEAPYLGIFRIEDGRIAELWVEWDNLYFLGQLGLLPPSDSE